METVKIPVQGMSCQSCVNGVTKAVQSVAGVSGVSVSLEEAQAEVTFDEAATDREKIAQAIADAGFEPQI